MSCLSYTNGKYSNTVYLQVNCCIPYTIYVIFGWLSSQEYNTADSVVGNAFDCIIIDWLILGDRCVWKTQQCNIKRHCIQIW